MSSLEMERAKQEAMAGLLKRQPSLHAALPQARVAQHHQRIQELSAQAAQLHTAILAESSRQRPVSTVHHESRLDLLISALAPRSCFTCRLQHAYAHVDPLLGLITQSMA